MPCAARPQEYPFKTALRFLRMTAERSRATPEITSVNRAHSR